MAGTKPAWAPESSPALRVDISRQLHKTKLCKHYLRGKCRYGVECSYAHDEQERRLRPDLRKTRTCRLFEQGKCDDGDRCPYAHGSQELRGTEGVWKTVLCASLVFYRHHGCFEAINSCLHFLLCEC
jgi:hypothetical protein